MGRRAGTDPTVQTGGRTDHDVGLWTDSVLNYLVPSADVASRDLGASTSPQTLQLIRDIIINHHKLTPFASQPANSDYDAVVNAVREAEYALESGAQMLTARAASTMYSWVDASLGVVRYGISRANQAKVRAAIPEAGFHLTLLEFGPRLHGWNGVKMVRELGKIFLW